MTDFVISSHGGRTVCLDIWVIILLKNAAESFSESTVKITEDNSLNSAGYHEYTQFHKILPR